jgi:hypothetical protein
MSEENQMNNTSQWVPVPIPEFASLYEINREGRVRNTRKGNIVAWGRPNTNSPFVILASKEVEGGRHAYTVSKLIKMAFPEAPARAEVDWTNTGSMLSELNFLRTERGLTPIKRWSKAKTELVKALQAELN